MLVIIIAVVVCVFLWFELSKRIITEERLRLILDVIAILIGLFIVAKGMGWL